jgi:hypothetical protein
MLIQVAKAMGLPQRRQAGGPFGSTAIAPFENRRERNDLSVADAYGRGRWWWLNRQPQVRFQSNPGHFTLQIRPLKWKPASTENLVLAGFMVNPATRTGKNRTL